MQRGLPGLETFSPEGGGYEFPLNDGLFDNGVNKPCEHRSS